MNNNNAEKYVEAKSKIPKIQDQTSRNKWISRMFHISIEWNSIFFGHKRIAHTLHAEEILNHKKSLRNKYGWKCFSNEKGKDMNVKNKT